MMVAIFEDQCETLLRIIENPDSSQIGTHVDLPPEKVAEIKKLESDYIEMQCYLDSLYLNH